jgi:hypothetical protein
MDYLFKILSSIDLFLNVKIDAIFIPLLLINFRGGGTMIINTNSLTIQVNKSRNKLNI